MNFRIITQAVILLLLVAVATSCRSSRNAPRRYPTKKVIVVNRGGHIPPGQAKKIYGDQSARSHAPGQKKKVVYYGKKKHKKHH